MALIWTSGEDATAVRLFFLHRFTIVKKSLKNNLNTFAFKKVNSEILIVWRVDRTIQLW